MTRNRILEFIDYWLGLVGRERTKVFQYMVVAPELRLVELPPPRNWRFVPPDEGLLIIGGDG